MSDNIVELNTVTSLDIPADRILRGATIANLDQAVVIGWEKDGEFYFASSYASGAEVIYLLELAKKKLLDMEN